MQTLEAGTFELSAVSWQPITERGWESATHLIETSEVGERLKLTKEIRFYRMMSILISVIYVVLISLVLLNADIPYLRVGSKFGTLTVFGFLLLLSFRFLRSLPQEILLDTRLSTLQIGRLSIDLRRCIGIQILRKTVRDWADDRPASSHFKCFELNLVLANCQRIHLFSHSDLSQLKEVSELLRSFHSSIVLLDKSSDASPMS